MLRALSRCHFSADEISNLLAPFLRRTLCLRVCLKSFDKREGKDKNIVFDIHILHAFAKPTFADEECIMDLAACGETDGYVWA